ncbi:hypothetical protein QLX08_005249 [Tetragonisca angustula]|uniref:Uncharacterized protein n=1 Tax=Tetragonisca angustula TaxID=166442 RepID=A0AAW0ZYR9_9HYME
MDINILNSDFVYFPDQAEYLKLSMKCPENMILWPGTRRCYREGEQGPCNIGRVCSSLFLPIRPTSAKDGSRNPEVIPKILGGFV